MKIISSITIGTAFALASFIAPASAGPGFAYSWLTTERPFEECIAAAKDVVGNRNYTRISTTRFGVTGESKDETLYINCEDQRHISVVLMRQARPQYPEIDALIEQMTRRLQTGSL